MKIEISGTVGEKQHLHASPDEEDYVVNNLPIWSVIQAAAFATS